MKTIAIILFLYSSFLATSVTYAESSTLTVNYPATSGSYNKITINTPTVGSNVDCTIASNKGLVFMANNTLTICATNNNGGVQVPVSVPTGETCFNRFANAPSVPACPPPYVQAAIGGVPLVDPFQTDATHHINSVVCCSSGSIVQPQ